jgi:hypothetical protein
VIPTFGLEMPVTFPILDEEAGIFEVVGGAFGLIVNYFHF